MDDAELIRRLAERWNAGDLDGALELFTEDAVMLAGPDWPEQRTRHGHEDIRANMEEWLSVWDSSEVEFGELESHGNRFAGAGTWKTRGRLSGAAGDLPFALVITRRDERIAALEWYTDYDEALAAVRGT
jgi:ketosteroid isomerase-like protein